MGSKLSDFLSDPASVGAPLRIPASGKKLPKSNFIGVAMVPKNTLPDIGSVTTFTPPGGGTAAPVTVLNLVSLLQALAFNGQAWVFGNGVITGKRSKFKPDEEPYIFGSRRIKRETGEGELTYMFMFKYAYMNTSFINQLRMNYTEYDFYVFTDRSVEVVRYDIVEPVVKNANNGQVDGANDKEISDGGFEIVVGSDGDIEPDFGDFEKLLAISNFKYTFGVPVAAGTGLTATLSGTVINKTAAGTGTITNAVTQTVAAGILSYSLSTASGAALPIGVTIDTVTGVVTLASTVPVGSYNLRVAVENKTGVIGEYAFKLIVA